MSEAIVPKVQLPYCAPKTCVGRDLTKATVYELTNTTASGSRFAVFTLELQDTIKECQTDEEGQTEYRDLISLPKIYMEIADPTEYQFAIHVFGSWAYWTKFKRTQSIGKYVREWSEELDIKLRSMAISSIVGAAAEGGTRGTTAAKYVAEKGWEEKRAGRPTKSEVRRELKVQSALTKEFNEDSKRLSSLLN